MSLSKVAQHNPKAFKDYIHNTGLLPFLNADINVVVPSPIIAELPISKEWSTPPEIDYLHAELIISLDLEDIRDLLTWRFNKRFTAIYGLAEYPSADGSGPWRIQYASKYWLLLTGAERKNLITHEMCHLAVERHVGYDKVVNSKKVRAHGSHWKSYMEMLGEDPDMKYSDELGISVGRDKPVDIDLLIGLLESKNEVRTTQNNCQS
jgi:hypothetical protein